MSEHSEDFFYLIDHDGNRRIPTQINARDGRYGYALHPAGKGNDVSAATFTTEAKCLVQAVVLEGRGVRCLTRGGPHDGQLNTLGLTGRVIKGYWLAPQYRSWVKGAATTATVSAGRAAAVEGHKLRTNAKSAAPAPGSYINSATVRFGEYCCQGGERQLDPGPFDLDDLTLAEEGPRRLRFSPLGNSPVHPRVALVGITPGGQMEKFASNLATMQVPIAASKAAFNGAQEDIKELLNAHGLSRRIGVSLEDDLNDNPDVLTTSIVKCCLMVDNGYRFKAPDIVASKTASHCATKRFIDELLGYPSLEWVVIFGQPGWDTLHILRRDDRLLIDILRDAGLKVLQLPHFSLNFQQRALFICSPSDESVLLNEKPKYKSYAPKARIMRDAVLKAVAG